MCEVNFGLDAKAELVLWHEDGEEALVFDGAEQKAFWRSEASESAAACLSSSQVDIEPGVDHLAVLRFGEDTADGSVLWDGLPLDLARAPAGRRRRPLAVGWRCLDGELRIRSLRAAATSEEATSSSCSGSAEPAASEDREGEAGSASEQLLEAMFAHHLAHFRSFVSGCEIKPKPGSFLTNWVSLSGGYQGLLCSGHKDGTIRIWLRGHSSLLLLHVLSIQVQPSLPWRPQFDPRTGAPVSTEFLQRSWYDGVDACPLFSAGPEASESSRSGAVTAVIFEAAAQAIVAGSASGEVVLFIWQPRDGSALSDSELAEWQVQGLTLASEVEGEEAKTSQGDATANPPRFSTGFACRMRMCHHQAAVTLLKVAATPGQLRVISADSASKLCVCDGFTGELLFAQFLDSQAASDASMLSPGGYPAAAPPGQAASGPRPPPETLGAVALADEVLYVAATPLPHQPDSQTNRPSSSPQSTSAQPASSEALNEKPKALGAYLLALSSGELRQMASPAMQFLDGRIRETRLPQLPGGAVLVLHLCSSFLLAVQCSAAYVYRRQEDGPLLSVGHSTTFASHGRAVAAATAAIAGEPCLFVLLASGHVEALALPSLRPLASLPAAGRASLALGARLGPAAGRCLASDGYFALQGDEGAVWLSAVLDASQCLALDEAARSVSLAQAVQALSCFPSDASSRTAEPNGGGMLSIFFRGGETRSLRQCASQGLPAEVDAARLDQSRGLPPAWRYPQVERPPPPPPPPPSAPSRAQSGSAVSAAKSVHEELAGAGARAVERGEK
ncbi:unnamed protein product, partial [Polarella glacialis]